MKARYWAAVLLAATISHAAPLAAPTSGAVRGGDPVLSELDALLLADAKAALGAALRPAVAGAGVKTAATSHAKAATASKSPAEGAPQSDQVAPPHETPWDQFFRTGVLASRSGRDLTDKLTVGPCEGGELLNLRLLR